MIFKLINKTDVSLKFLLITDVRIESYHDAVGMGGFGRVYRGDHKGQQVALKVLDKEVGIAIFSLPAPKINTGSIYKDSRKKDFCREALAWRSLVHKFILPLVGIFEEKSQQFLVSPLMKNGTLTQWRKSKPPPPVVDVHRLVSFDASKNS